MAAVEYDLDLTGGLMEEIERLVAPPETSHGARKRRIRDREQRRPGGKTVNRDSCDSCQEGGDLLCCDRCPAAFHLQCHDPPLEEEHVPMGEWVCHRCLTRPQTETFVQVDDDAASTCSSRSRQSEQSSSSARKPRTRCRIEDDMMDVELAFEDAVKIKKHPLEVLAKAASYMNPRQFELPKDVNCTLQLEGSSKRKLTGTGRNKKPAHELDNGYVILPAKLCFICSKSCRWSPLVPCDYCPLFFHMDCLDPPLTSLPSGRWMCPNHVEHSVDEKLLNSVRVTERVKLYDKYCHAPVNQHAVKVKFLNRIHRRHPPFRIKGRQPRPKTIKVPDAIKAQYEFPPPLLPALDRVTTSGFQSSVSKGDACPSQDEQEQWLAGIVHLQASIAQHMQQKQHSQAKSEKDSSYQGSTTSTTTTTTSKPTASVIPVLKQQDSKHESPSAGSVRVTRQNSSHAAESLNGDISPQGDIANGPITLSKGRMKSLLNTQTPNGEIDLLSADDLLSGKSESLLRKQRSHSDTTLSPGDNTLPSIRTVSKSGSTEGIISGTSFSSSSSSTSSMSSSSVKGTSSNLGSSVKSKTELEDGSSSCLPGDLKVQLDSNTELDVNKLDEGLLRVLAYQRLQQLIPQAPSEPEDAKSMLKSLEGMITPEVTAAVASSSALQAQSSTTKVRARALLCPLTSKGQPVPMCYKTLSIGTGGNMNVCLSNFGHCNYVSPRHAWIFYDEMSRQYELLNYSEHGTTVDNVLYSCDFSDKSQPVAQSNTGVAGSVRKLISKARAKQEEQRELEKIAMSAKAYQSKKPCRCRTSSSSLIGGSGAGWEGSALLHHGSYIKMGCIQFVFSIVDHATKDPRVEWKPATSLIQSQFKQTKLSL